MQVPNKIKENKGDCVERRGRDSATGGREGGRERWKRGGKGGGRRPERERTLGEVPRGWEGGVERELRGKGMAEQVNG